MDRAPCPCCHGSGPAPKTDAEYRADAHGHFPRAGATEVHRSDFVDAYAQIARVLDRKAAEKPRFTETVRTPVVGPGGVTKMYSIGEAA